MAPMKFTVALLLAFALPAFAQTPTFSPTWSWKAPTQCSDGTPVVPTTGTSNCTITKFTLYTGLQGAPLTAWGTIPAGTLSVTTPNTSAGIWCGQVTASDANGEGAPSTQACITLAPTVLPGSPTNPVVTLTTTSTIAYMIVPGKDTYGVLIVGSVPLATPCVASKPVLTYYVVPSATVTFTTGIKPPVVVANCS
jgi:hypothetical protein